jgi:hypothetical protein
MINSMEREHYKIPRIGNIPNIIINPNAKVSLYNLVFIFGFSKCILITE